MVLTVDSKSHRVSVSGIDHIINAGFLMVQAAGSLSAATVVVHGGVRVETPRTLN